MPEYNGPVQSRFFRTFDLAERRPARAQAVVLLHNDALEELLLALAL
jgi:hypothetical protein